MSAETAASINVPAGFALTFDQHWERYPGDKLAYDVFILSDAKGPLARFADLLYKPRFCVNLGPVRNRHFKRLVMNNGVVHGLAYDRSPQGEGTLQAAVDAAVQQLARIREFLGEL